MILHFTMEKGNSKPHNVMNEILNKLITQPRDYSTIYNALFNKGGTRLKFTSMQSWRLLLSASIMYNTVLFQCKNGFYLFKY